MVNAILDAVSKRLGETFGTSYHYYVEDVEQKIKKPCFTIDIIAPQERSKSAILYDRTMPVVVHYFTDKGNMGKKDCYAVGEQLIECLEYLPFKETIIRGEEISYQMVDDVLQAFITYRFTTRREMVGETIMEVLSENKVTTI